jgi:hypothetical protein
VVVAASSINRNSGPFAASGWASDDLKVVAKRRSASSFARMVFLHPSLIFLAYPMTNLRSLIRAVAESRTCCWAAILLTQNHH